MSRTTVRTATAFVAALVAISSLGGCAAGFNASTSKPYTPTNGALASVGKVQIRSLVIVGNDNGSGQADLIAVFVNSGTQPDALTSLAVQGADPISLPGGSISLTPQVAVPIGPDSPNRILLGKLTATPGLLVKVTVSFRDAGSTELTALVMTTSTLVGGG